MEKLTQLNLSVDVIGNQCMNCQYLEIETMQSYTDNIPIFRTTICKHYTICRNAIELKERKNDMGRSN